MDSLYPLPSIQDSSLSQIQLSPIKKKRIQDSKISVQNPKPGILLSQYLGINNHPIESKKKLKPLNKYHLPNKELTYHTRNLSYNHDASKKSLLGGIGPKFKVFIPPISVENPILPSPKGKILHRCKIHHRSNEYNLKPINHQRLTALKFLKEHRIPRIKNSAPNKKHKVKKLLPLNRPQNNLSLIGKYIPTQGEIQEANKYKIPLELLMDKLTI